MWKFNRPSEIFLPPTPFIIAKNLSFDPSLAQHARVLGVTVKDIGSWQQRGYEIVERKWVVEILPVTLENKVILILQYRIPVTSWVLECPAGQIDASESPSEAAVRELREETGYPINQADLVYHWATPSSAGFTDEYIHMFSVSNIQSTPGATDFGDGECIIPLEIDVQDIAHNIEIARELGIMVDPRLLILLMTTGLLTAWELARVNSDTSLKILERWEML